MSAPVAVFAIADPHLSKAHPKPMDIFGPLWERHDERFFANWRTRVGPEDTVLVAGDISWALELSDALVDLQAIDELPGRKILIQGNHDYWWQSLAKIRALPLRTISFLQNDSMQAEGVSICGTRGWLCPGDWHWAEDPEHNAKIYDREAGRLGLSLQHARKHAPGLPILAMLHYPPLALPQVSTRFTATLEAAGDVVTCVYGHLHGASAHQRAFTGEQGGVHYRLVAGDALDFTPVQIWPPLPSDISAAISTEEDLT